MNVKIKDIKTKVRTILNELVTAGTLGTVSDDTIADPLNMRAGAYPFAVLQPTLISQSVHSDNCSHDRVYIVGISVVFNNYGKGNKTDDVDEITEAILDYFDEKLTLDGDLQNGWVEPTTTAPYYFEASKDKVAVDIILNIHTIRQFTYQGQ